MIKVAIFLLLSIATAWAQIGPVPGGGGGSSYTPPTFNVKTYGAQCDGKVIYSGVTATNGSAVISTGDYSFTSADVGATITIASTLVNTYSASPLTSLQTTISSVSGGNATLAANWTHTTGSGYSARWYHTVDTTAIQAALTAAHTNVDANGGGTILFPAGVCVTGQLTFYSNEHIVGQGVNATVVMLANGQNSDLFEGYNFASLTGGNTTGGVGDVSFENMTLDGNRGANTGSGIGTSTGTGDGVRVYGYQLTTQNIELNNFAADGWYSEWSTSAGTPIDPNGQASSSGLEAKLDTIKGAYNAGYGMVFNGPHDSRLNRAVFLGNGTGGIIVPSTNGGPFGMIDVHGYAEGGYDITWRAGGQQCYDCIAEVGMLMQYEGGIIINSYVGGQGLLLGASGDPGSEIYDLQVTNSTITTVVNNVGSGYNDIWSGGSVGAVTGTAYAPFYVSNTLGLVSTAENSFQVSDKVANSWDIVFSQNSANTFTITNYGSTFFQNVQINSVDTSTFFGVTQLGTTHTVSSLPTCNSSELGVSALVSDAASPAYNATLTGGGTGATAKVSAWCNGTNWVAH